MQIKTVVEKGPVLATLQCLTSHGSGNSSGAAPKKQLVRSDEAIGALKQQIGLGSWLPAPEFFGQTLAPVQGTNIYLLVHHHFFINFSLICVFQFFDILEVEQIFSKTTNKMDAACKVDFTLFCQAASTGRNLPASKNARQH